LQEVTLAIADTPAIDEDLAGFFAPEGWLAAQTDTLIWDDVRKALGGIAVSLSDAVTAQRQAR
jgi:hypothetical protein